MSALDSAEKLRKRKLQTTSRAERTKYETEPCETDEEPESEAEEEEEEQEEEEESDDNEEVEDEEEEEEEEEDQAGEDHETNAISNKQDDSESSSGSEESSEEDLTEVEDSADEAADDESSDEVVGNVQQVEEDGFDEATGAGGKDLGRSKREEQEKTSVKPVPLARANEKAISRKPTERERSLSPRKQLPSHGTAKVPPTRQQSTSHSVDVLAQNLSKLEIKGTRENLQKDENAEREVNGTNVDRSGNTAVETQPMEQSQTENRPPKNIFQQEREDYIKQLKEDPSFTPIVGNFWGHDDRCFTEGLKRESQFRRRRAVFHDKSQTLFNPELAGDAKWDHSGFEELMRLDERDGKARLAERGHGRPYCGHPSRRQQENRKRPEIRAETNEETTNGAPKKILNGNITEKIGESNERSNEESISKGNNINTQLPTSVPRPKRFLPSKQLYVRPEKNPSGYDLAKNRSDAAPSTHQDDSMSPKEEKTIKISTPLNANHDIPPNFSDDIAPQTRVNGIEHVDSDQMEQTIETTQCDGDNIVNDKASNTAEEFHETINKSKRYSSRRPQPPVSKLSSIPIKAVNAPEFQPKRFLLASNPAISIDDTPPKTGDFASNAAHDPSNDPQPNTSISNNPPSQDQNPASTTAAKGGNYGSASTPRRTQFVPTSVQNERNFDSNKNKKNTAGKYAFAPVQSHGPTNTEYPTGPIPTPMMGMNNGMPMAYAPPGYVFVPQYGYPSGMPQMYGMQHEDPAYGSPYAYFSPGVSSPSYPATTHANYGHSGGTVYYSNPPEARNAAVPANEVLKYGPGYEGFIPPGGAVASSGAQAGYFYSPQPYWHPGMEEGSGPVKHTG